MNVKPTNGYFSFKGVSSMNMGVFMLELPTRPTPAERGENKDVAGLDGKLWISEYSYERVQVKVKVECAADADIDAINAWLTGGGDLVFGDEPNRCYHARVIKGADRTHSMPRRLQRTWTQVFDCEPFRYETVPCDPISPASGTLITNPGTIESKPLIKVNCNGSGTLMIGGVNTMIFNSVSHYVYIDCDAKIAYKGTGTAADPYILMNHKVTGEWAVIPPGRVGVQFTGNVTSIEIVPRWRWI